MTNTVDNLGADADAIYSALIAAHEGLSEQDSSALDARLILLLMNEVGDKVRLEELLGEARRLTEAQT